MLRDAAAHPVAFICFQHVADEAEILRLGVAADRRGEGWGQRTLQAYLTFAQQCGIARVLLEVRATNASAIRLYREAGFTQWGQRPGYFQNPTEDALVYQYRLQGTTGAL